MLVLDKDKEELLVSKYGFEEWGENKLYKSYTCGKGLRIYSANNCKYPCEIRCSSMSRNTQDVIYKLIKDDVLTMIPNEYEVEKVLRLQEKVRELEEKIKTLEENRNDS